MACPCTSACMVGIMARPGNSRAAQALQDSRRCGGKGVSVLELAAYGEYKGARASWGAGVLAGGAVPREHSPGTPLSTAGCGAVWLLLGLGMGHRLG
jgi:hypothetical protein